MAEFGTVTCPKCERDLRLEGEVTGVHDHHSGPYAVIHVTNVTGCEHVEPPKGPSLDETVPDEPGLAFVANLADWFGWGEARG